MAKKGKWSRSGQDLLYLDIDTGKILQKIEKAGGNIKPALERAVKRSLPIVQSEFKNFAEKHKRTGGMSDALIDPSQTDFVWGKEAKKRFVGQTKKGVKGFSGGSVEVVSEEDYLFFEYGFDLNTQGGLRALWLDIGTPKRTPKRGKVKGKYFIYYGIEKNLSKIHAIQKEELSKIAEGLQ